MAASSSAATSSVVDLGMAAELDTATSAFFDDGSAHFSWPAAEQAKSVLTGDDELQKLCNKYGIPKEYMPVLAGDMATCAVKWGKPSRAAVRKPVVEDGTSAAAIVKLMERAGSREHAADVAQLKDELEKANAARAAEVGRLKAELEKARGGSAAKVQPCRT